MKYSINIFLIILFLSPKICFAGGAVLRRKRQLEQKKQQIQQQQEAYRQQTIQQQEAYRQRALQQQKEAYRQRSLQQQQAVQQRQIQQQQEAYHQRVIRQKQLAAQQRAIQQQKAVAQQRAIAQQKALQRKQILQVEVTTPRLQKKHDIPKQEEEVKEVVTLEQIWRSMEATSEVWSLMMDVNPKVATVDKYIEWYKQRGIIIQNPPIYYVQMIDTMSKGNPSLLKNSFEEVLKKVAIIEYDFDNGRDKDLMAREILGEEAFQRNKERLGR